MTRCADHSPLQMLPELGMVLHSAVGCWRGGVFIFFRSDVVVDFEILALLLITFVANQVPYCGGEIRLLLNLHSLASLRAT